MTSIIRLFCILCLTIPLAFADVGPAPPAPQVTVYIVQNGQPETSVTSITYNCLGAETQKTGAVEPTPMTLDCSNGTCTNSNWYYKLNPCYYFPWGHFSYEFNGKTIKTENMSFDEMYKFYTIVIDAPSGDIRSRLGSNAPLPSSCSLPSFILPALLLVAFIRR